LRTRLAPTVALTLGIAIAAASVWLFTRNAPSGTVPSVMPGVDDQAPSKSPQQIQHPSVPQESSANKQASHSQVQELASASDSVQRTSVLTRAPRPGWLQGRVVDAQTSQGLPGVEVSLNPFGDESADPQPADREGRFRIRWSSDRMMLRLGDRLTGRGLGTLAITPESLDGCGPEGLVLPVQVGPTLIVKLLGAPHEPRVWRYRLSTPNDPAPRHGVSWNEATNSESSDSLVLRVKKRNFGDGHVTLHVLEQDEGWVGAVQIEKLVGVVQIELPLSRKSLLVGRIVDELGEPQRAWVSFTRDGDDRSISVQTAEDGSWQLKGLDPGPGRLHVESKQTPTRKSDVEVVLVEGRNPAIEVPLPRP